MPITRIGICAPRSATKSNRPVPTSGSRLLRAELADLGLQRVDLARGEHPGQQLAVDVVDRRILENHCAGRDLDVGLDQLEDRAAGRAEGFVVHERLVRRRRSGSAHRSRAARCSTAALLRAAAGTSGRVGVELDVVRVEVDIPNGRVFALIVTSRLSVDQGRVRQMAAICLITLASASRGCQ